MIISSGTLNKRTVAGMALRQRVGCAFKSQGLDVGCNNLCANGVSHVLGRVPQGDFSPFHYVKRKMGN